MGEGALLFYRRLLGRPLRKVTFEKESRGNQRGNHVVDRVKNAGRALSKHRGPEVGECLSYLRNNKD